MLAVDSETEQVKHALVTDACVQRTRATGGRNGHPKQIPDTSKRRVGTTAEQRHVKDTKSQIDMVKAPSCGKRATDACIGHVEPTRAMDT